MENNFNLERFENMNPKQVLEELTAEEYNECAGKVRGLIGTEAFNNLTQKELEDEIFLTVFFKISFADEFDSSYPLQCRVSNETAKTIHNYARRMGINHGEAVDQLTLGAKTDDPETAAVIAIAQSEIICSSLNDKDKIKAMFIMMGAFMDNALNAGYSFDKAAEEIRANINKTRNIIDRMKSHG